MSDSKTRSPIKYVNFTASREWIRSYHGCEDAGLRNRCGWFPMFFRVRIRLRIRMTIKMLSNCISRVPIPLTNDPNYKPRLTFVEWQCHWSNRMEDFRRFLAIWYNQQRHCITLCETKFNVETLKLWNVTKIGGPIHHSLSGKRHLSSMKWKTWEWSSLFESACWKTFWNNHRHHSIKFKMIASLVSSRCSLFKTRTLFHTIWLFRPDGNRITILSYYIVMKSITVLFAIIPTIITSRFSSDTICVLLSNLYTD